MIFLVILQDLQFLINVFNSDWLAQTRPLAGRIFWHPFFSSRLGWPISPDPKWPFSGTPTPTGYPGGVTFAPNMAQNRVRKSCSTNLSRRKIFKFLLAGEWFWGNYQPQIIKKCHIPRFRGRWAVSFRAFFKNFQIHFWPPKQLLQNVLVLTIICSQIVTFLLHKPS